MAIARSAEMTVGNAHLRLGVRPDLGGKFSSLVAVSNGHEQLAFFPPQGDVSELTHFMEMGGWGDVVTYRGGTWPGPLWNQPFVVEKLAHGVEVRGEKSPVAIVRRAVLADDAPKLHVRTTYRNVGATPLAGIYIFPHSYVLPGGFSPRSACLMPGETDVTVVRLDDEGHGRTQAPVANWWAVTNPGTQDTVVLTFDPVTTMELNLYKDARTFVPQTMGQRTTLAPGEAISHDQTLHHFPVDLTPVAAAGATWFAADSILSVHAPGTVVDTPLETLPVTVNSWQLGDTPAALVFRVLEGDTTHQEQTVIAGQTINVDLAGLGDGHYRLELAAAGDARGARWPLTVVIAAKARLTDRLGKARAAAADLPEGVRRDIVHRDLDTAAALLDRNALDRAESCLALATDNLEGRMGTFPNVDIAAEFAVGDEWVTLIDRGLAELPETLSTVERMGVPAVGPDSAWTGNLSDWHYPRIAEWCYPAAWAYLNPKAARHGDPELLRRVIAGVDYCTRDLEDGTYLKLGRGDPNIPRFAMGPLGDAIRLLLHLPVGAARKARWLDHYRRGVEYQIRTYGSQPIPAGGYLNQDVMYLLIMRHAEVFYGDPRYTAQADHILAMIESQLLPDGAFYYLYPHNEVPGYHEIDVLWLGRAFTLFGDERTRDLIARTVDYYPVTTAANGFLDGTSVTWWKETAGRFWPWVTPTVVAGITGDPRNRFLANRGLRALLGSERAPGGLHRLLYAAPFAGAGATEPLADNVVVRDRNIAGVRGKFGAFCWFAGAGHYRHTQVGASLFVDEHRGWSLDFAGAHVYLKPGKLRRRDTHGFDGYRLSPKDYPSALHVGNERAVFACGYPLQGTRVGTASDFSTDDTPWYLRQLWYGDSQRLVGLLELTVTEAAEAHAADLAFWFVPQADALNEAPELTPNGDAWRYGDFRVRVWEATGAENGAEPTSLKRWPGHRAEQASGFFTRLMPPDGRFAVGQRLHLLVEIRPAASPGLGACMRAGDLAFRLAGPDCPAAVVSADLRAGTCGVGSREAPYMND